MPRDPYGRYLTGPDSTRIGRPGGAASLARKIREATNNGQELVDFAMRILRDENQRTSDRLAAATLLAQRGWGNPPQTIEIAQALAVLEDQELPPALPPPPLARLGLAGLAEYEEARRKVQELELRARDYEAHGLHGRKMEIQAKIDAETERRRVVEIGANGKPQMIAGPTEEG